MITRRTVGIPLTLGAAAVIAAMTLVPHQKETIEVAATSIWCLLCGALGTEDVILNIFLFVPLGLGLGLWGLPFRRTFLIVVATTLAIESLQWHVVVGRDASLSDLLSNTLGGTLGFILARWWPAVVFPAPRDARLLLAGGAACWVAVQAGTAALLAPSFPATVYYGQWAPELGHLEFFRGHVLEASINGDSIPGTRLHDSDRVREALRSDRVVISVAAIVAEPTAGLAPIFSMYDEQQAKIFLVGQQGRDVVFEIRQRTGAFKLRNPAIALPDAVPAQPGDTIRITVGLSGQEFFLNAGHGEETRSRRVGFSPSWGWTFILPYDYSFGPSLRFLTALWIGGLLLPLGYWGRRAEGPGGSHVRETAFLLLTIGLGLGVVTAGFGFPAVDWSEWVGAMVGIVTGWSLGSVSGRR